MKNNTFRKILSVTLAVSIIGSSVSPAFSLNKQTLFKRKPHAYRHLKEEQSKTDVSLSESPSSLSISPSLGRIVEVYRGTSDKVIIHIQDRHADNIAQLNIAGIIDELANKHSIALMCLEGASKELNTSFYDEFPDGEIKEKVSKFFVRKALFTGAEYYKITNKDRYLRAFGAEDKNTYLQHLASYKDNVVDKEHVLEFLKAVNSSIDKLKDTIYTKAQKNIDKKSKSYSKKQIQLPEHLKALDKYSKEIKLSITKYDNLSNFIQLVKQEEGIDFKKAEFQRESLIRKLSESLDKETLDKLIKDSVQFRLGKITQEEFYNYLKVLIEQEGLHKADYKDLIAYCDYIAFSKTINHLKVFDETEDLEEELMLALCSNQAQRNLVLYSKSANLLQGLYGLKLTRRQLDYLDNHSQHSNIFNIQQFLRRSYSQYGLNLSGGFSSFKIDQDSISNSKQYYELALKRDIALVDNTLKGMQRNRKRKAILITGGFHTSGITSILKQKGISYIVICPAIGAEDCEKVYCDRMAGKLPDISELTSALKSMLVAPLVAGDIVNRASSSGAEKLFALAFKAGEPKSLRASSPGDLQHIRSSGLVEHLRANNLEAVTDYLEDQAPAGSVLYIDIDDTLLEPLYNYPSTPFLSVRENMVKDSLAHVVFPKSRRTSSSEIIRKLVMAEQDDIETRYRGLYKKVDGVTRLLEVAKAKGIGVVAITARTNSKSSKKATLNILEDAGIAVGTDIEPDIIYCGHGAENKAGKLVRDIIRNVKERAPPAIYFIDNSKSNINKSYAKISERTIDTEKVLIHFEQPEEDKPAKRSYEFFKERLLSLDAKANPLEFEMTLFNAVVSIAESETKRSQKLAMLDEILDIIEANNLNTADFAVKTYIYNYMHGIIESLMDIEEILSDETTISPILRTYFRIVFPLNYETAVEFYKNRLLVLKKSPADYEATEKGAKALFSINHKNIFLFLEPTLRYILETRPDKIILLDSGARVYHWALEVFIKRFGLQTKLLLLPASFHHAKDEKEVILDRLMLGEAYSKAFQDTHDNQRALNAARRFIEQGKKQALKDLLEDEGLLEEVARFYSNFWPINHADKILVIDDNIGTGETLRSIQDIMIEIGVNADNCKFAVPVLIGSRGKDMVDMFTAYLAGYVNWRFPPPKTLIYSFTEAYRELTGVKPRISGDHLSREYSPEEPAEADDAKDAGQFKAEACTNFARHLAYFWNLEDSPESITLTETGYSPDQVGLIREHHGRIYVVPRASSAGTTYTVTDTTGETLSGITESPSVSPQLSKLTSFQENARELLRRYGIDDKTGVITSRLYHLFGVIGHSDAKVAELLLALRPGNMTLAAAAFLHDIGKTGPPSIAQEYIDPMIIAQEAAHNVVARMYSIQIKPKTKDGKPIIVRVDKNTTIREFLQKAVKYQDSTGVNAENAEQLKEGFSSIINPFTDRVFDVDADTMGDFWNAHILWSVQILEEAGVPKEVIRIVAKHHQMDAYYFGKDNRQPEVITLDEDEEQGEWKITRVRPARPEDIYKAKAKIPKLAEEDILLLLADKYDAALYRNEDSTHTAAIIYLRNTFGYLTTLGFADERFGRLIEEINRAGLRRASSSGEAEKFWEVLTDVSLPVLTQQPPIPDGWTYLAHKSNLTKKQWDGYNPSNPFSSKVFIVEKGHDSRLSCSTRERQQMYGKMDAGTYMGPAKRNFSAEEFALRNKPFEIRILFPVNDGSNPLHGPTRYPYLAKMIYQYYSPPLGHGHPEVPTGTRLLQMSHTNENGVDIFYYAVEGILKELAEAWNISGTTDPETVSMTSRDTEDGKRASSAGKVERDYTTRLYPMVEVEFSRLPQATQEILTVVGISDDLVKLAKTAGRHAGALFYCALAPLKELIIIPGDIETSRQNLKTIGTDLIELAEAAKTDENAVYLFNALPYLVEAFGIEFIKPHWQGLVIIGKAAGESVGYVFKHHLPALKESFGIEFINDYWQGLVILGEASHGAVFARGLTELKKSLGIKFIKSNWQYLVVLGKTAGMDSRHLFGTDLAVLKRMLGRRFIESHWQDITDLVKAAGKNTTYLFRHGMRNLRKSLGTYFIKSHWQDLVELGKAAGEAVVYLFEYYLPALKESFGIGFIKFHWHEIKMQLLNLCRNTTDYNRERILSVIFDKEYLRFLRSNEADFFRHLTFYRSIIMDNPRLAFTILEGTIDAIKTGYAGISLPAEEQAIIREFISQTSSFHPLLFKLYKEQGKAILEPLREFAKGVSLDNIGRDDIDRFLNQPHLSGYTQNERFEILSAAIQMAIPASGASFIRRSEIAGLLKKYIESGDRRSDVPAVLRDTDFGKGEPDAIQITEYMLRQGETLDLEKAISAIVSALRQKDMPQEERESAIAKDRLSLISAMGEYLKDFENPDKRQASLEAFFTYASHNDFLRQKIDTIQRLDYLTLLLLEQLFIDKDNLSTLLRDILRQIAPQDYPRVAVKEQKPITNVSSLARSLNGIWQSTKLLPQNRQARIEGLLKGVSSEEIEERLLALLTDEGLISLIRSRSVATRPLTPHEIIESLFRQPLSIIKQEQGKFDPKEGARKVVLEFRVVKGIPQGLWGLNAGVCVATDMELWQKKNFFLLEMFDRESQKVVGYVHLFETDIDGERVLTLPGIEPSTEFLSEVKAEQFYPLLEKALIRIKEKGGYSHLYLPTLENGGNITSNRADIVNIVSSRYGKPILPLSSPVNWNTIPVPYPFTHVWEVAPPAVRASSAGADDISAAIERITELAFDDSKAEVRAKYHLTPQKVFMERFKRLFGQYFTYADFDFIRRGSFDAEYTVFVERYCTDKKSAKQALSRLWELYNKYVPLVAEANKNIPAFLDIDNAGFVDVAFVMEGPRNPMREIGGDEKGDMRLALNVAHLFEREKDIYGLVDVAHEAGHGILNYHVESDYSAEAPDEAAELAANWVVAQLIPSTEDIHAFILRNAKAHLQIADTIHPDTAAHLLAFARAINAPTETVALLEQYAPEQLTAEYARYYDSLRWKSGRHFMLASARASSAGAEDRSGLSRFLSTDVRELGKTSLQLERLYNLIGEKAKDYNLSQEDIKSIEEIAQFTERAHRGQPRYGSDDYFCHPIGVATILLHAFEVADPVLSSKLKSKPVFARAAIKIALMHDLREDQKQSYEDFLENTLEARIKERREEIKSMARGSRQGSDAIAKVEELELELRMIRLGVRMLTNLNDIGYETDEEYFALLNEYLRRLVEPDSDGAYKRWEDSDDYYTDEFIHVIQLIKAADILYNMRDQINMFEGTGEISDYIKGFPARSFEKLLGNYIPNFIMRSQLTPGEQRDCYQTLVGILEEQIAYASSPIKQKRAKPLLDAAEETRRELVSKFALADDGRIISAKTAGRSSSSGEADIATKEIWQEVSASTTAPASAQSFIKVLSDAGVYKDKIVSILKRCIKNMHNGVEFDGLASFVKRFKEDAGSTRYISDTLDYLCAAEEPNDVAKSFTLLLQDLKDKGTPIDTGTWHYRDFFRVLSGTRRPQEVAQRIIESGISNIFFMLLKEYKEAAHEQYGGNYELADWSSFPRAQKILNSFAKGVSEVSAQADPKDVVARFLEIFLIENKVFTYDMSGLAVHQRTLLELVAGELGYSTEQLIKATNFINTFPQPRSLFKPEDLLYYVALSETPETLQLIRSLEPYGYQFNIYDTKLILDLARDGERSKYVFESLKRIQQTFPSFQYKTDTLVKKPAPETLTQAPETKSIGRIIFGIDPYALLVARIPYGIGIVGYLRRALEKDPAVFRGIARAHYFSVVAKNGPKADTPSTTLLQHTEEEMELFYQGLREVITADELKENDGPYFMSQEIQNYHFLHALFAHSHEAHRLLAMEKFSVMIEENMATHNHRTSVDIFEWVNFFSEHGIQDPIGAVEGILRKLGKAADISRLYRVSCGVVDAVASGAESYDHVDVFDLDIFETYIKDIGLYGVPTIFRIYTSLKKGGYADSSLQQQAEAAGITAMGEEGISQMKEAIGIFYQNLIYAGDMGDDILEHPFRLDLLRIASNFDQSYWTKKGMKFVDIVRGFLESKIAPLPSQFFDADGNLRKGTIKARKLRSDFDFKPDAVDTYGKILEEIRRSLDRVNMPEQEIRMAFREKAIEHINTELNEVYQAIDATDNENALKHLEQRKERLEPLKAAVMAQENLILVLTEYLDKYDKKGKYVLGRLLREMLFTEGFKLSAHYAGIFSDILWSKGLSTISVTNASHVLGFLGNVVEPLVLEQSEQSEGVVDLTEKLKNVIAKRYLQVKPILRDHKSAMKNTEDVTTTLTVMPTRGILGELIGYLSDVCIPRITDIMRDNPDMVGLYFVENADDPVKARIVGGSLLILTTVGGKEAFVIRALNPQDRVANNYSSEDLVNGFIDYIRTIPEVAGERIILAPETKTGALSDRPSIVSLFAAQQTDKEPASLDRPNDFNGYNITNKVIAVSPRASSAGLYEVKQETTNSMTAVADSIEERLDTPYGWYDLKVNRQFGLILENTGFLRKPDMDILRKLAENNKEAEKPKFVLIVTTEEEKALLIKECDFNKNGIRTLDEYLAKRADLSTLRSATLEEKIVICAQVMKSQIGTQPVGIIAGKHIGLGIEGLLIGEMKKEPERTRGIFVACQEMPETDIMLNGERVDKENAILFNVLFAQLLKVFGEYMVDPGQAYKILYIIPAITDKDKFTEYLKKLLFVAEEIEKAA